MANPWEMNWGPSPSSGQQMPWMMNWGQAPSAVPEEKPSSMEDAAKSLTSGAGEGAINLAMLPADLGTAAAKGIDWIGRKVGDITGLGYQSPRESFGLKEGETLSGMTLPTSQDVQKKVEEITGPFYKPQTTAGKYAHTVGEFLPGSMLGPGGLVSKATRMAVLPGLASEAAGQATEGKPIEPYARLGAGIAASLINPARAITPNPTSPERQAMVNTLQNEGVTALTAGQRTGSEPLKYFESAAMGAPFSGATATARNEQAAEQFTSAALRRAGIQADRATPQAIDQGFTDIGNRINALSQRNVLNFDQQLGQDLQRIQANYANSVNPSQRVPRIENTIQELTNYNAPQMTGVQYQTFRSQLSREAREVGDNNAQRALNQITSALDDAMERSIAASNPGDAGAFREARSQYRNMLVLEKAANTAGEKSAQGVITPAALASATKSIQGLRNYARGQGDFADLARSGVGVMSPLPNSGTEQRGAIMHGIETAGGLIGGLLGYGVGGGEGSIAGAVSGPYAARFTGAAAMPFINRALLSNPGQAYLGNQLIPRGADMELQRRLLAAQLLAAPQQTRQ